MNNRELRLYRQTQGIAAIQKKRGDEVPLLKGDSLNDRARKLGIAIDLPFANRELRRRELRQNVRTERKAQGRAII